MGVYGLTRQKDEKYYAESMHPHKIRGSKMKKHEARVAPPKTVRRGFEALAEKKGEPCGRGSHYLQDYCKTRMAVVQLGPGGRNSPRPELGQAGVDWSMEIE